MFKRQFYHETCWNIMASHIFRGIFLCHWDTSSSPQILGIIHSWGWHCDIYMYTVYYINIDNGDKYDHFHYIMWYYVYLMCILCVYYMYVYVYIICMYIIISFIISLYHIINLSESGWVKQSIKWCLHCSGVCFQQVHSVSTCLSTREDLQGFQVDLPW